MKELLFHIKYYPIIVNIYILFAMAGCLMEIRSPALYLFIGQSFYYNRILWLASKEFKFCSWHRVLIFSMTTVLVMELLYNYGIYINFYLYICIGLVILSMFTSTILFYKYGCFSKKKNSNCFRGIDSSNR